MARNKAGAKFEHDDPTKPAEPAVRKSAEELHTEEAAVLKAEKFPVTLTEGFELLAKLNQEPVANRAEWEAKQKGADGKRS